MATELASLVDVLQQHLGIPEASITIEGARDVHIGVPDRMKDSSLFIFEDFADMEILYDLWLVLKPRIVIQVGVVGKGVQYSLFEMRDTRVSFESEKQIAVARFVMGLALAIMQNTSVGEEKQ